MPPEESLPITALVFDIGNVLIHWNPRLTYAPLFQGKEEKLDYFLDEVCSLAWQTRHDRGITVRENIRIRQKEFPEYAPMIAIFASQWDNITLMEGMVKLVRRLRDLGYPLFALTNFAAEKYAEFSQKHHFMSLFQDVIVSGEEKVTKPSPRIYQILLERTAIIAEQTLFIDDRRENLIAAHKFGLQTHLFTDAATLETDLLDRGIFPT